MSEYEKLLKKYSLKEEDLSTSLRKRLTDIRKLQQAIPVTEGLIASGNLSVSKKNSLQEKLDNANSALPIMEAELAEAIEKWYPKRAQNAAAGQRLQTARAAKAASTDTPQPPTPAAASTLPATIPTAKPAKKEETAPPSSTEGKPLGIWGWVGICLGAAVLGVAGVAVARRYSQNAG